MHRRVAGAIAAVVVLGAAGCGSSEPTPKAQFVKQADAICRQLSKQTGAALAATGKDARGMTAQEKSELLRGLLAKLRGYRTRAADALEELRPPTALEERFDAYAAAFRQRVALLPTAADVQSKDDSRAEERQALGKKTAPLAKALGFKACS